MNKSLETVRKLGFGLMRLPQKDGAVDVEQVKEMVDLFMEAGFTYFDTAWAYAGSEDAIRQALVERYPRERFQLATKNAAWINCKTKEEACAQFDTSLAQTGAGYFDFYLLHNLGEGRTRYFDEYDMWSWVQEKKKAGLVRHVGFSFHSTPEELEELLTAHPEVEFVQLQINYADWENPAVQSRACYEVAQKHGKSVIIMEPVKGGMLATPPESVAQILKAAEPESSAASWAIRFAADLEGVITVRNEQCGTDERQSVLYEDLYRPYGRTEKDACTGTGRTEEDPADPVYFLQLLCQGLSAGNWNLRFFHSHELSDALPGSGGGKTSGGAVMAADTRTNVSSAENVRKSVRSIFRSGMS